VAQAGVRISAVDLDAGMLGRLRSKVATLSGDVRSRISVHHADMRSFALDEHFALVMIPFRAFLHNLTFEDQLSTLQRAYEHLKPGGELALNVFHPSLEFMAAHAGAYAGVWRARQTRRLDAGGFVVYSEMTRYHTVSQRLESLIRTEEFAADGTLVRTHMMDLELAYLHRSDILRLLDHSGFELVRISGDFKGRPFERDGDELVVEAHRD
jgi:SAM-dependent methyltransferase